MAAELAGVHPQTLRIYERKGLIEPSRTSGRSRRYSDRDIALLQRIQELTNEGVSLVGVRKILASRPSSTTSGTGSTSSRRRWPVPPTSSSGPSTRSTGATGVTSCRCAPQWW